MVNHTRQMGYNAQTMHALIELALMYFNNNTFDQVDNIITEINSYHLDWWQIDLVNALYQFSSETDNKNHIKELALKAHANATESWKHKHQQIYDLIVLNKYRPIKF